MLKKIFISNCAAITLFISSFSNTFAADQLIIEPNAGRAPLLNAIHQAKSSINLVMYGFTDNQLLRALTDAQESGKKIQVLIEPHPYQAEQENDFALKNLQAAKINLHYTNPEFKLTHQKTFIFDHHQAMIMTFNLTRSSFKNERNFALITDDPGVIHDIEAVFNADWQRKSFTSTSPRLFWSPEHSQDKILKLINTAHSSIDIYAQDLTDYKIIGALARAAKQGISVNVLLSNHNSKKSNNKLNYLTRKGVNIHFSSDLLIHAKVIIIDKKQALIGSTNFTYPSMQQNRELSILTTDPEVIRQLNATFAYDSTNIMKNR